MKNEHVIAMTLYRRPDYTERVLHALAECEGIGKYTIFIHMDRSKEYRDACAEVAGLVNEFESTGIAKACVLMTSCPRKGCDLAKLAILPLAYRMSDFVIFLEDDTLPAPDFLQWMEWGADEIYGSRAIASVTGYSRADAQTVAEWGGQNGEPLYAASTREGFKPWGWGMWKDHYDRFYGDSASKYLSTVDNVNGRFDWWISGHKCHFLYPLLARVQCIGAERAEHTPSPEWFYKNEHNPYWSPSELFYFKANPAWTMVDIPPGVRTMDNE